MVVLIVTAKHSGSAIQRPDIDPAMLPGARGASPVGDPTAVFLFAKGEVLIEQHGPAVGCDHLCYKRRMQ